MRSYTYKIEANSQLRNCICGALSTKDGGVTNILVKALWRRIIELQLLWCFTSYCKSELLEINIGLIAQKTALSTAQFWKGYFRNTTLDWYFVQIMWPQFLRLAVVPFIMRNSL